MKVLRFPIHTYLFAVYFPVFLLSNNLELFLVSDSFRAIGICLGIVFVLVLLLNIFYHDRHKAALAVTALVGLTFSYTRLANVLSGNGVAYITSDWKIWIGVYFLIAGIVVMVIHKMQSVNETTSLLLNISIAAMLVLPLYKVTEQQFSNSQAERHDQSGAVDARRQTMPDLVVPEDPPTVFHFVLDGYSRHDVLERIYGYENLGFIESLRGLGFFVADRATAPYGQTLLSMTAVFSMDYLDPSVSAMSAYRPDLDWSVMRSELRGRFRNSPVRTLFEQMDYRIVAVDGGYLPVRILGADKFLTAETGTAGLNIFEIALLGTTPFYHTLLKLTGLGSPFESHAAIKVVYALEDHNYESLDRPFFLYNHIMAPHPPFNIDRNGNPRANALHRMEDGNLWFGDNPALREQYRQGYIEKLRYTNDTLFALLEGLVKRYPDPKVIIVHGDHGGGLLYDQNNVAATCLPERFSPLLAVYSSDDRLIEELGHDMNLVNIYRTLFRTLYSAQLPPLKDKHAYATWDGPARLYPLTREQVTLFGPECVFPREAAAQ